MSNFTFLSKEQIIGENQLEILKKYGTRCAITDFSVLLGGATAGYFSEENSKKESECCYWWTKSIEPLKKKYRMKSPAFVYRINVGELSRGIADSCIAGARPVLPYSKIQEMALNGVRDKNGILEVEYGEYPQDIVSKKIDRILERAYQNNTINQTGKSYTTKYSDEVFAEFYAIKHIEYEYNGKKYIRIKGFSNRKEVLSDGRNIQEARPYWVVVKPIKWLIEEKTNIALSKKAIFSGVNFDRERKYKCKFKKTDIKKFMDKYFSKEIIPSNSLLINSELTIENNFEEKITNILEDIKKYTDNIQNKEMIKDKINNLLENYNKQLDTLKNNEGLSLNSKDNLKNGLVVKLNIILDNLKNYYENNKEYYQILNDLDKIIDMFNKNEKQEENKNNEEKDIVKDFNILINQCLPFLIRDDREKNSKKLLEILSKEKSNLIKYIKSIENFDDNILLKQAEKIEYKTYEEFEILLREKIHPILIDLNIDINKRNVELEVKKGLNEITNNIYEESKDKMLSLYLNEINNIKKEIDSSLMKIKANPEKYMSKLKEILSKEIDYNKDITELLKDINNIIISLHRINFRIKEHLKEEEEYNDSRLNIRFK